MNKYRNYIDEAEVVEYLRFRKIEQPNIAQLVNMINYFAEGAVTTVSTDLFTLMEPVESEDLYLSYDSYLYWCDSPAWVLKNEDNKIVYYTESLLEDWVKLPTPRP